MRNTLFTFIAIFSSLLNFAQKDLNINYKLRGYIYASSSIEDTTAFGGFGRSDNSPKPLNSEIFTEKGFFLKIDTSKNVILNKKFNGYKLFIVNQSDSIVKLVASDSRLSVVAQAYVDNKWQDIEFLPSSWCGNSYHVVSIKPKEFWEFDVPKFSGKFKTKLRYKLTYGKKRNQYLYSNEIATGINKKQLKINEKYQSQGIMDPYDE